MTILSLPLFDPVVQAPVKLLRGRRRHLANLDDYADRAAGSGASTIVAQSVRWPRRLAAEW